MSPYLFLSGTILFTVAAQLLVKYAVPFFGPKPTTLYEGFFYLLKAISNLYFLSGLFAALLGSFCWIFVLQKLKLSYAYPFMSLTFIFVLIFSYYLFNENIPAIRWIGVIIIILGVSLVAQS